MRKIVLQLKNGAVETFSPKWFSVSFNNATNQGALLEKSSMKLYRFTFSRVYQHSDEIRFTDVEDLKIGGVSPPDTLHWQNQKIQNFTKEVNSNA